MSSNGYLDCHSFEERIHQILDDRLTLTGDELLMAHASDCAECENLLHEYDLVDDSVKLLPADLAELVRESEITPKSQSFAKRQLAWLVVLAALVVISVTIFHGLENDRPNRSSTVAQSTLAPQFSVVSHQAKLPQRVSVQPSRSNQPDTPDSSPFSPNFSVVDAIPGINLPPIPWNEISRSLDQLETVLDFSSRIPSVRPVHCSFNITINLLKRARQKVDLKPSLGSWTDPNMLAAV